MFYAETVIRYLKNKFKISLIMQKSNSFLIPVAAVFVFFFSGCLKIDEPKFQFYSGPYGYVVQTNSSGSSSFYPYIGFQVTNGTLVSASVTKSSLPVSGDITFPGIYETRPVQYSSLDDINGIYDISATDELGNSITSQIKFKCDKSLGEMKILDFRYENNRIYSTIANVDNATYYGFFINPIDANIPPYSRVYGNNEIYLQPATNTEEQSMVVAFPSSGLDFPVEIYPIAYSLSEDGNIMLQGEKKILHPDDSSFE
jgi:hypothetical protein